MKIYRQLITVLVLLTCSEYITARELYFTNLNVDNGLSESNVKAITQDNFGFVWFGTRNGLNRYDGRQIRVFDVKDETIGRTESNVGVLLVDNNCKLWVGTDTGIFIFDPITEKFSFFQKKNRNGRLLDNWVSDIRKDKNGNIWIVIPGQGVFKYNQSTDLLSEYRINNGSDLKKSPQCLFITPAGQIFVGSNGIGIFRFNEKTNTFIQYLKDRNGNSLENQNVYTMCEYKGRLIIGIHEGKLMQWDFSSNSLEVMDVPDVHYKIIRKVVSYDNENLLIATQAGLFVYNENLHKLVNYHEDDMNPYSLSDNMVYSIFKDNEEGIWIGTLSGGVNYAAKRNIEFSKYVPERTSNSVTTKKIRELCEDANGNIWIGSENGGVNIFNPKSKTFRLFEKSKSNSTNLSMFYDNNKMYIGYFKRELDVLNLANNQIKHYDTKSLGIKEGSICSLFKDSQGNYWLGNADEVSLSKGDDLKFVPRNDIANGYVYDIKEDPYRNIWFATIGIGVYCYNMDTKISRQYLHDEKNIHSLSSNSVSSITVDAAGKVWFSTDRGGICCYNRKTDNFTRYSIKEGLPDNVAYKILVDKKNNLWFGTNKGLVKFNPQTKSVRVFTKSDGLLGNQFSYKSAMISRDGTFYFGGTAGLISFNPYYNVKNKNAPPVYITGFYIHNKEVRVGDNKSFLTQTLLTTKQIKLDYKSSNISLDFAALSYTAPAANQFAFKMDGVDKDWIYTHNQSAYYSQLPPGDYVFHVKASNNDGVWNNDGATLEIIITPPWWKSIVAYFIYTLLLVILFYILLEQYIQKKEKKNLQARNLFEIKKEQELYRAKVDFFTSIAHEIKTPLSLIKGPLEEVIKRPIEDNFIKKSLEIMELNTNRLLSLINQLLDFRKIDANKITLNFTRENINDLILQTVKRFEPTVNLSKKELILDLPEESLYAPVDKEEFIKILSNLLNNALKYSTKMIRVALREIDSQFSVQVVSDGKTIPEDLREKIFEPFYQLKNENALVSGVGIGLSLARSLAELHSGSLTLKITGEGYNNFILNLPLNQDNVILLAGTDRNNVQQNLIDDEAEYTDVNVKYTVMLVDDNTEILHFLSDRLASKFNVVTAGDGEEAIEKLSGKPIHLIISDVMMPKIDGLELCRYVKGNIEYSHIPIILLTAKNDLDSKIKGLEMGADAYLEKPFSLDHLVAQSINLLTNREKERSAFAERPFFPVYNLKMNTADKEFITKVIEEIQSNISDENLNVERLAELLSISRSVLHRKIKNLVNMVPVDFIRVIRLKKAAELIQSGKFTMAEISVMVGINSPSYFSKLFFKQFGVTPKTFYKMQIEELKNNNQNSK